MEEYDYAHFDTSKGERRTRTAALNKLKLSERLIKLREAAFERHIPTADDETLNFLITQITALQPENILEIGTATGVSSIAMLEACPSARLTTVEKNEVFYSEAKKSFACFGVDMRVNAILSDACIALDMPPETYDFVFLDCAKVQYVKLLPKIKKLLKKGGVLFADDVLLFGWVTGETEIPKKRKMLAAHICEYVQAVTGDEELSTSIIDIGDGIALSVKL